MRLTARERRDLLIFMRGLPPHARNDANAIRILAQLYAELQQLPAGHVLRRIARQEPR